MKLELTTDGLGLRLTDPPYKTEGLTLFVTGNKGSGKSNIKAVIAEEMHRLQIPFLFFDPNGDAVSLRELGDDVIIVGDPNHSEPIRRADYALNTVLRDPAGFVEMLLNDGFSFVFDLTDNDPDNPDFDPLIVFTAVVNEHYRQSGRLRTPAGLLVDEAHTFAPQRRANKFEIQSRRALGRMATDGRKRGVILVTSTQRATYLDKKIIFGANVRIFGKITYWPDFEATRHYYPHQFTQMKSLKTGEAIVVAEGGWGRVQIKHRQTTDLGKTPAFNIKRRKQRPSKALQLQLPLEIE